MQLIKPISIYRAFFIFIIIFIMGCYQIKDGKESKREEILSVEKEFMEKVEEWGIKDAFLYFADDSAVLVRNDHLVRGKQEIAAYYNQSASKDILLTWQPAFVEVSNCGDLAYTYGPFSFTLKDSTGREMVSKGIFHTVWKRQADGSWKYVYD